MIATTTTSSTIVKPECARPRLSLFFKASLREGRILGHVRNGHLRGCNNELAGRELMNSLSPRLGLRFQLVQVGRINRLATRCQYKIDAVGRLRAEQLADPDDLWDNRIRLFSRRHSVERDRRHCGDCKSDPRPL